jgi:methanogenic corrinoid protein MtbC1
VPACDAARLAITATAAQLPAVLEESVVETFASRTPTTDATALVRGLTKAADALDSLACSHILQTHIDKHGVEWTWNNILTPVMIDLGRRWEINESGVEIEHLLSECALGVFNNVANKLTQAINVRPVLLSCSPDDLHSLPIAALSAALATRGIASRNLGARVPHDSLVSAMNKLGPSCVVVWAQTDGCCDTARLAGLPHHRPQARVFAAGPGWSDPMPEGVTRIHSFSEGLEALAAAAI